MNFHISNAEANLKFKTSPRWSSTTPLLSEGAEKIFSIYSESTTKFFGSNAKLECWAKEDNGPFWWFYRRWKNWFESNRYIFGQNTPNDYWWFSGHLSECEVIFSWLDVITNQLQNNHPGISFWKEKSRNLLLKMKNVCLLRSNESSFGEKISLP